jgi:Domain of unknown function (DUF3943)
MRIARALLLCSVFIPGPCAAFADDAPPPKVEKPDTSTEVEATKSYAIPAAEIFAFDYLLNRLNRRHYGADYAVNMASVKRNLHSGFVVDSDPFKTNQLGHPYQGSMYHGFARSAGLNFWESMFFTFAGSAGWEVFGETTPPSRNDQIASGIGGSFLGESLFRMASLMLEKGNNVPGFVREGMAAVISPPTGFNRLAFGERFSAIFASQSPEYYSSLALALSATTQNKGDAAGAGKRSEVLVDYSLDYGLPGKPGYHYSRPFDYFSFRTTASSANGFENVMTRGLLLGTDYDFGQRYRGVWGLYGSYDYISPQTFRVSSTALSLGTTGQLQFSDLIALQGTALAGTGYAAVSTPNGPAEEYHYGIAPQALLALRLIAGDRASLDVTAREYFVSNIAAGRAGGHDNIVRADIALTVRVDKQQAVALKYLWNRRDAAFPGLGDRTQTRGTIGLYYVLLGDDRFGAVDWR